MFHFVQLLIAFLIIMLHPPGFSFQGDARRSFIALVAAPLILIFFVHSLVFFVRQARQEIEMLFAYAQENISETEGARLKQAHQTLLQKLHRRVNNLGRLFDFVGLAAFFILFSFFHFSPYLRYFLGIPEGLDFICFLAFYFLLLCIIWSGRARMQQIMNTGSSLSVLGYCLFHLRMGVFSALPLMVLGVVLWFVKTFFIDVFLLLESYHFLHFVFTLGFMLCIVYGLPFFVRFLLPTEAFPERLGRAKLLQTSDRCQVKVDQVYLWKTGRSGFPTAFLIGLGWPFRYVFISDALVKILTKAELKAVFAHELGHARHKHLWLILFFLISFALLQNIVGMAFSLPAFSSLFTSSTELYFAINGETIGLLLSLLMFAGFILCFGYLSKRLERQADFFAARHEAPEMLASSLDKLATAAGGIHFKRGWRHFPIFQRIRELGILTQDEDKEGTNSHSNEERRQNLRRWERERKRFITAFIVCGVVSLCLLVPFAIEDFQTGKASYAFARAENLRSTAKADEEAVERSKKLYQAAVTYTDEYLDGWSFNASNRFLMKLQAASAELLAGKGSQRFQTLKEEISQEKRSQTFSQSIYALEYWEAASKRALLQGVSLEQALESAYSSSQ